MPKNRIVITLGVIIALLPALGFPHAWEAFFQVAAGLSIVLLTVWVHVDKRLTQKAKARARQTRQQVAETPRQEESEMVESVLDPNQFV